MSKPNIYNLLVLGKVGIGKSAMVRLLTGRQDCLSSSQKKSHTKNAKMYNSVL
jgi:GTP-binding protein EngB required for normal cell division